MLRSNAISFSVQSSIIRLCSAWTLILTKTFKTIALMRVYVRPDNCTTKSAFRVETCVFYHNQNPEAAKVKRISICNVPED